MNILLDIVPDVVHYVVPDETLTQIIIAGGQISEGAKTQTET